MAHWRGGGAVVPNKKNQANCEVAASSIAVFLKRRAATRYRALASIIPGRERFSWNLSF